MIKTYFYLHCVTGYKGINLNNLKEQRKTF